MSDHRKELAEVRNERLALDLDGRDELSKIHSLLEAGIFQLSLKIWKLLQHETDLHSSDTSSHEGKCVKLPKLEVPQFNGNIIKLENFLGTVFDFST